MSASVEEKQFLHEKKSLKGYIEKEVNRCIFDNRHLDKAYFITFHGKFVDSENFNVTPLKVSYKIPKFLSNTLVFWVSNKRGISELLWTVSKDSRGKIKVDFNKKGVAYLTAKGALPNI